MHFSKAQRYSLISVIIIYTAAYLNRLNLAAALNSIINTFSITPAQGGLLQSVFALTYTIGQLVNGSIAERVNARNHMLLGLSGSAICNLLMSLCPSYPLFIVLCILNGAFQSMMWTIIVRLIGIVFPEKKSQRNANLYLSVFMILGHLGAWAISGYMAESIDWHLSFRIPGLIGIPAVIIAWMMLNPIKDSLTPSVTRMNKGAKKAIPIRFLIQTGFIPIMLSCVLYGFVRDGITTWAPTILQGMKEGSTISSTTFSLIIPMLNLVGLFISFWLMGHVPGNVRRIIALMILACAFFCLFLRSGSNVMILTAIFMGAACACLNGLNILLTSMIPLEYAPFGHASITAGLIDSLIYLGSALTGVATGSIIGTSGINSLYWIWVVLTIIGSALMFLSGKPRYMDQLTSDTPQTSVKS